MIELITHYYAERRQILTEMGRCRDAIRVSQHLLRRLQLMGYARGGRFAQTCRYQLARQAMAIVHADRAEDRLAAIPKPYVLECLGGAA